jgi:hypothetical protein
MTDGVDSVRVESAAGESAGGPAGQPGHDVFVSYSTRDKPVADAIVSRLEQAGVRCWFAPRDVMPGSVWGGAIVRAIETSRMMVVVLSGEANHSPHVLREVERAVANNVVVVPFRIESVEPTGAMAYYLASEHWLDALTPPLDSHIAQLVKVTEAVLDTESAVRAEARSTPPAPPADLPPPPQPRRPRRLLIGVAAGAALVILGVMAAVTFWPSPTVEPRWVDWDSVATGDCLLTPDDYAVDNQSQSRYWQQAEWDSPPHLFAVVPCEVPHGAEVYFAGDAWSADEEYPGDRAEGEAHDASCEREFEAYVGVPLGQSELGTTGWVPGSNSWAQGDRRIACLAFDLSGNDLERSVSGTGR